MLITSEKELKKYYTEQRIWQGIPGIEVTKKGRIFSAFYTGGSDEERGNYIVLLKSDDGVNFSEPIAAVYKENSRCFDECIWIDPSGRLWLIWSVMPNNALYGVICENPDAKELEWGEEFLIGYDVMLNKPTVLSTGEWLFPISVWGERVWSWMPERRTKQEELGAFVYRTNDKGKSFEKLGKVVHPDHAYDEHMLIELKDYRIMMLTRTMSGIGVSYSYDRGETWTKPGDSGLGGGNSRFHIRRLKSGNILLVIGGQNRKGLTAMISEDECKTWKHKFVLDEREQVSYPDAAENDDGYIYITYDRDRGCGKKNFDEVYASAREILYAKITEADIAADEIVTKGSALKCIISKLGKYEGEEYSFEDKPRLKELVPYFAAGNKNEILEKIFEYFYRELRPALTADEHMALDNLADELGSGKNREQTVYKITRLLYNAERYDKTDVADLTRKLILEKLPNKLSEEKIAENMGIGRYYLHYRFKMQTGITVKKYIDVLAEIKNKNSYRGDFNGKTV